MAGGSIEFKGRDAVLTGYELYTNDTKKGYFTLWQGTIMKYACVEDDVNLGVERLDQLLFAIEQSGSKATYSIRFYTATNSDGTLDTKTPYAGSCNFIVNDSSTLYPNINQGSGGSSRKDDAIMQQLAEMKREIQELKEDGIGAQDPSFDWNGFAHAALENPGVQGIIGAISGLITESFFKRRKPRNSNMSNNNYQPPQATSTAKSLASDEAFNGQMDAINDAVNRLFIIDPDLGKSLLKLADFAEKNPNKYKAYLQML